MASRGSRPNPTKADQFFVGRQQELALISRRLLEARSGRGSFISISGEPGIGKTRLAQIAASTAEKKGFEVFWGQCHDGQYVPPYWPWKQLLKDLVELVPSKTSLQSRAIVSGLSEILSGTSQGAATASDMPQPMTGPARLKLLESVTSLLRIVSENRPLLLILDNLHCADVPSLQLLQVVSREMSGHRIVIVGSYRDSPAEASPALRETIGSIAGQSFFEGIALPGLDAQGVKDCLVANGVSDPPVHLVNAIHERTEGNPLFVLEVVRLLKSKGSLRAAKSAATTQWEKLIPEKVRLAIVGSVERLSPRCRDALAAAALLGREFEVPLLRELLGEHGSSVEASLAETLAHGLIEEIPDKPGSFKFTHALVQDVVREQTPATRKSALHLRTAQAIELHYAHELDVHSGELARHFDAAGPEQAEKALRYYRLAGERALRMLGFADAYHQLSRAVALGKGKIPTPDMARLLFALGQCQHGMGAWVDAVGTYTEAFDLFVQGGETDNAVHIVEQELITAERPARLTHLLEKAMSIVGPDSPRAKALGGRYGHAVYHDTGDYQRSASIFEVALRSAREAGDKLQEMTVLCNWGRVEIDELHFEKAIELEEETLRLAQERRDLWTEAVARSSFIIAHLGRGHLQEAERESLRLFQLVERYELGVFAVAVIVFSFAVQRQKGNLGAAKEMADSALFLGYVPLEIWIQADQALAHCETGDATRGAMLLQKTINEADMAMMASHWEGWLPLLIAYVAWVTGEDTPLATAELVTQKLLSAGGLRRGDVLTIALALSLIAVLRKDRESATRHYEKLLPFAGRVVSPYLGFVADHILALLASTMGANAGASKHFDSALAFCRANNLALELAYTCRDYAEFLSQTAARTEASRILALCDEAAAVADSSGLVLLKKRLQLLRDTAGQGKAGRHAYPDSLSEREVDVLRLLSEGLSNAQIGERLFISLYTVANHVQSILQKTRAANRTEAAAYAVKHGMTAHNEGHEKSG